MIGAISLEFSGSVGTKDIPPRRFAAGAPAQVVRKLGMDGPGFVGFRRRGHDRHYAAPPPSKVPSWRIR